MQLTYSTVSDDWAVFFFCFFFFVSLLLAVLIHIGWQIVLGYCLEVNAFELQSRADLVSN